MKNMRLIYCIALLLFLLPALMLGQDLRLIPYSGQASSYINAQIAADTVANGKLPNRTYVLTRGALYLANAVFTNTGNWTLRIKANDSTTTKKPVVMLYPSGTGSTPWNPPGNFIQMGGSLVLKNIELTGYYELVDTNRWNMQGALINIPATASSLSITIDSCILSNVNGNHIRTDGVPSTIRITNTVFANLGYLGRSNLGAGKAVDLRNVSCDSLIMVNNTFVNWLDRIVRHYPATGATSTGALGYFQFDHNTLVNGTSYHGLLSLGSMGAKSIITNNLFYDPFILGNDTDATRQVEYIPSGELDKFGGARMTWIFSYPNTTTAWTVANNYYCISDSGQAFYNQFSAAGVTGEGSPLTWHINGKLGADSTKAFTKLKVALNKIPATMTQLARWYRAPNGGNKLKNTPGAWVYGNASDPNDFDRKKYDWLRDSLSCVYPTTSALFTGAVKGFPVGYLNWFPTSKSQWLVTDVEPVSNVIPSTFQLQQNFPNPFNPSTTIQYSIAQKSHVVLEVFNVLGQSVARLYDGELSAGTYHATFDASRLSSGVYLYRLQAGDFVQTQKMVLMK
ncbi:MAG TPA: T9SS type A sorting domain-containing protein [Bacteroidota bacterium]|nr:T9SS type A sorting domain-containing protein [Bacteroidota bacterium]